MNCFKCGALITNDLGLLRNDCPYCSKGMGSVIKTPASNVFHLITKNKQLKDENEFLSRQNEELMNLIKEFRSCQLEK